MVLLMLVVPLAFSAFSGGKLKVANKQYSSLKSQYEITFDQTSEIRPVQDDATIQRVTFNFKKVGWLGRMLLPSFFSLCFYC